MAPVFRTLLVAGLLTIAAEARPKVLPMRFEAREKRAQHLDKRDPTSVTVENESINGLYLVNASIGDPPQAVQLQLDTGSADLWMFGPRSCDLDTSKCLGGSYDRSKSKTGTLIGRGNFEISYQTPNSGVVGDYIADDLKIGDLALKNLTMAVSTSAKHVQNGIMGVGPSVQESIVVTKGAKPYPNFIDEMVNQGVINTRAYSLYLDDLNNAQGTILFGGYDRAKYLGDLVRLPIVPDARTGTFLSFSVAWTSMSVTEAAGTTFFTPDNYVNVGIFDSGATLTMLPLDLFRSIVQYSGAVPSSENVNDYYLLPCNVSTFPGTVNFGFGPSLYLSVGWDELVLPPSQIDGKERTFADGSPACRLGFGAAANPGDAMIFGDTFLRSQYVVYDIDHALLYVAPTRFNATESDVVEIGEDRDGGVRASATVAPNTQVSQSATLRAGPGLLDDGSAAAAATVAPSLGFGQVSGAKTTVAGIAPVTAAAAQGTSSSKAGAASAHGAPMDLSALWLVGFTAAMMALGSTFVAVW